MKNLTNFSRNNSNSIPSGFFNLLNKKNYIENPNQDFIDKNLRIMQNQQSKIDQENLLKIVEEIKALKNHKFKLFILLSLSSLLLLLLKSLSFTLLFLEWKVLFINRLVSNDIFFILLFSSFSWFLFRNAKLSLKFSSEYKNFN